MITNTSVHELDLHRWFISLNSRYTKLIIIYTKYASHAKLFFIPILAVNPKDSIAVSSLSLLQVVILRIADSVDYIRWAKNWWMRWKAGILTQYTRLVKPVYKKNGFCLFFLPLIYSVHATLPFTVSKCRLFIALKYFTCCEEIMEHIKVIYCVFEILL